MKPRPPVHRIDAFLDIAGLQRHRAHQRVQVLGVIAGLFLMAASADHGGEDMFWLGLLLMFAVPFGVRLWCRGHCPSRMSYPTRRQRLH